MNTRTNAVKKPFAEMKKYIAKQFRQRVHVSILLNNCRRSMLNVPTLHETKKLISTHHLETKLNPEKITFIIIVGENPKLEKHINKLIKKGKGVTCEFETVGGGETSANWKNCIPNSYNFIIKL